jgi:hypothetical protein
MRKTYLREHQNISYESYTKLFGRATKNSNSVNLFGTLLTPEKGVFYLSESISSHNQYDADTKSEKLEASLILNDSLSYSKNNSVFIELYTNHPLAVYSGSVTNRFISPISVDAFTFYDYDYMGSIEEGNLLLHKIKLIPRSKGSTTFTGEIYIVDKSWRLYKTHLFTNNRSLGNLEINTTYIQNEEQNTFLPFSMSFILKNKSEDLDIYQHSIFYNYVFNMPPPASSTQANYIVSDSGLQKKQDWWESKRPISLTEDEEAAYRLVSRNNKGIQFIKEENDSLFFASNDSKKSVLQHFQLALNTKRIPLSENTAIKLNFFTFNTVEGGVIKPHILHNYEFKNGRKLDTDVALRYGFASNNFYTKMGLTYELNPSKLAKIRIEGGHYIEQISGNASISDFVNMFYSLEQKLNYQKLYGRDYIALKWNHEVFNGFDITIGSSYNIRHPLKNNTGYTWARNSEKEYMPNQPLIEGNYVDFETNKLWESNIVLSYHHNRKFNVINGRKVALSSKYPKVNIGFDMGMMDTQYNRFWANISDNFYFGSAGISSISVSYGQFLSARGLTPVDYFHFMGNRTIFYQNQKQYGLAYQLLDYYQYSNDSYFGGANFEHDFGKAVFARVPLMKKLGLNTYIMANYLQSANNNAYSELGFGLSSSYFPLRLNYFFGFERDNFTRHGFMMHVNF